MTKRTELIVLLGVFPGRLQKPDTKVQSIAGYMFPHGIRDNSAKRHILYTFVGPLFDFINVIDMPCSIR